MRAILRYGAALMLMLGPVSGCAVEDEWAAQDYRESVGPAGYYGGDGYGYYDWYGPFDYGSGPWYFANHFHHDHFDHSHHAGFHHDPGSVARGVAPFGSSAGHATPSASHSGGAGGGGGGHAGGGGGGGGGGHH